MARLESRDIHHIGIALALGAAALGTGAVSAASAIESQRLQDEHKMIGANTSSADIKNPRAKEIEADLSKSLTFSGYGGAIAALSVVGVGVTVYINRRRPEQE